MDKHNFKARVVGDVPPRVVDAEWEEGTTGTITLTLQREGEEPYRLRIGTNCGDPWPQLYPDPALRARFSSLPEAKQTEVARYLNLAPPHINATDFHKRLFSHVFFNDLDDEFEKLIAIAERKD